VTTGYDMMSSSSNRVITELYKTSRHVMSYLSSPTATSECHVDVANSSEWSSSFIFCFLCLFTRQFNFYWQWSLLYYNVGVGI